MAWLHWELYYWAISFAKKETILTKPTKKQRDSNKQPIREKQERKQDVRVNYRGGKKSDQDKTSSGGPRTERKE